jgi:hypothetical protein
MNESSCLAHWMRDPAWPAMDPTAQGFHTRLLLLAAGRRPRGVLPDDDRQWRRWLGLPPAGAALHVEGMDKVWEAGGLLVEPLEEASVPKGGKTKTAKAARNKKTIAVPETLAAVLEAAWEDRAPRGVARRSYEGWLDWLWTERWRPQIQAAWVRVDAALLADYPGLASSEGQWFHPLALRLGQETNAASSSRRVTESPRVRLSSSPSDASIKKPGRGVGQSKVQPSAGASAPLARQRLEEQPWNHWVDQDSRLSLPALDLVYLDLAPLLQHEQVWRAWQPPLTTPDRKTLWEVGVSCLATGITPPERRAARDQLGKLIAQYGEAPVGAAVAKLALRPLAPADALPFLVGMLRNQDDGTPAERKARERRTQVAL